MTGMKERGFSKEGRENYKNITTNRCAGEITRNGCRKAAEGEQGKRKEVIILGKNLTYCMECLSFSLGSCFCSAVALFEEGKQVVERRSILISQSMVSRKFRSAVHIVAALSLVSHAPVDAGAQSGRRTKQLETLSLELPGKAETS